jgi:hypothetical protein
MNSFTLSSDSIRPSGSSVRSKITPSITSILKVISDEKAHVLFNRIVAPSNANDRLVSPKEINLSFKEYHSRLSGFLKADLIKRHEGKYTPTMLGRIVYDSQLIIVEAISNYWKLKALDEIEMSNSDLPTEEIKRLINALIGNYRIKDVLVKTSDVKSVNK